MQKAIISSFEFIFPMLRALTTLYVAWFLEFLSLLSSSGLFPSCLKMRCLQLNIVICDLPGQPQEGPSVALVRLYSFGLWWTCKYLKYTDIFKFLTNLQIPKPQTFPHELLLLQDVGCIVWGRLLTWQFLDLKQI